MASAERELYRGSRGRDPSAVQGQSPWSGGQGAKAPEAERKWNFVVQHGNKPIQFTNIVVKIEKSLIFVC